MQEAKPVPIPNRLLAALPRKDYRKLLPSLELVEMPYTKILYESRDRIRYVYFPNNCLVSMLTTVNDRQSAEVGLIGSEGMVGLPVALGVSFSPFRAVVQGSGTAMRMKIADFRREFSQSHALQRQLLLFTHLLMIQIAQTAACNRFHPVAQRMARWLLMTSDRMKSPEFRITQDFLSLMLGVRRSSASLASSNLEKTKLIGHRRGIFYILDHRGLEAAACECYKTVKATYTQAQT